MIDNKDRIIKRNFFSRDTALVARKLLGKILVRNWEGKTTSGIIIETEAYYGIGDPASHAFRGVTPRSRLMFGRAGVAYVYLCYGVYWLLNVVTEKKGIPGAVLIRGIKPVEGVEEMKKRRDTIKNKNLTDGPGKITVAMSIDGNNNGTDMTIEQSGLYIINDTGSVKDFSIKNTSRIGITNGRDRLLRFIAVGL